MKLQEHIDQQAQQNTINRLTKIIINFCNEINEIVPISMKTSDTKAIDVISDICDLIILSFQDDFYQLSCQDQIGMKRNLPDYFYENEKARLSQAFFEKIDLE